MEPFILPHMLLRPNGLSLLFKGLFLVLFAGPVSVLIEAQTRTTMKIPSGRDSTEFTSINTPLSGDLTIEAAVHAHLLIADESIDHNGKLFLTVVSEFDGPGHPRLLIKLPLASVAEAYGESRSCNVSKKGRLTFVYTAGLDENNFVPFSATKEDREFRFLLNKYLCRALAAPFHCYSPGTPPIDESLPRSIDHWKVGRISMMELGSKGAPASATVSSVVVTSTGKPFDYASCERIAPSNGLCCVAHKTTEWHCGGSPVGAGWHQVSAECFHRETGGVCKE